MCASVHADFCRPKGLESARPGPAPTQYGTTEVIINYQYGKNSVLNILNVFTLGHCSHWRCHIELWHLHIGANSYHDYRQAWQAVFSVVYMSVTVVSQHETSK